jgi:hypothetical protein
LTVLARKLAEEHLEGVLLDAVRQALDDADAVRTARNEVVHQDWILRGAESGIPVEEIAGRSSEEIETLLREYERKAVPSKVWQRVPARSISVEPAPELDELIELERRLGGAAARVLQLTYVVASSRETGGPPGYK